MFLYSLYGYEENVVLTHEKEFSEAEFDVMCKEAELGGMEYGMKFYSIRKISKHLKENYGFQSVNYKAGFFVDKELEDENDE